LAQHVPSYPHAASHEQPAGAFVPQRIEHLSAGMFPGVPHQVVTSEQQVIAGPQSGAQLHPLGADPPHRP
jgi:hypothetical protein